jgi:hypothetical protein
VKRLLQIRQYAFTIQIINIGVLIMIEEFEDIKLHSRIILACPKPGPEFCYGLFCVTWYEERGTQQQQQKPHNTEN